MAPYAQTLTFLFAVATVLLLVMVGMVLLTRITTGEWLPPSVRMSVARYGIRAAALFAVGAMMLSLWYSEIVGIPVCPLCWFARTMMYPLGVILVVAVVRKARDVVPYALTLSTIGMLITGYHHLYQLGFVKGTLCTAIASGGDCAKRYVFEFGFVTMPLMGFALFASVALLLWISRVNGAVDEKA